MDEAKPTPVKEYHEGEEAAQRFINVVKRAATTPPVEVQKRDKEWRKRRKPQHKS